MSSENLITRENMDTYLKAIAKQYRKLVKKAMPAEITLVGGASILINYGFRDSTYDIDALIHAASAMKDAINFYVEHRREVVVRRTKHDLAAAEARAHIVKGLLIAQDNIDEVIKIIRESYDDAKERLIDIVRDYNIRQTEIAVRNTPGEVVTFGDGGNDTSMIRTAGIGIAMGNAIDSLKAEADYVTTTVDDNGIRNALKHFELI